MDKGMHDGTYTIYINALVRITKSKFGLATA